MSNHRPTQQQINIAIAYLMLAATYEQQRNIAECHQAIAQAASQLGVEPSDNIYYAWGSTRVIIQLISTDQGS